jgi:hypothetical protein
LKLAADKYRPVGLALLLVGALVIVANSFGQELFGWGFVPGGLIGAGMVGFGIGLWLRDRRER